MKKKQCSASLGDCIHSRRCFMSGEYCSKQANITRERERLHSEKKINAFVIMNFSDLSDVVYKWRIKSFIRSLKNCLSINDGKITCHAETLELADNTNSVVDINVIRADNDTASNYVVCNRICQQIQMADIVIVDVSVENTNVFYELGMAMAMGKLILPICYSESFFEVRMPQKLTEYLKRNNEGTLPNDKSPEDINAISRHIDCYPWRRTLFEHFGIRYRSQKDSIALGKQAQAAGASSTDQSTKKNTSITQYLPITHYLPFTEAVAFEYGFSDIQYRKFPYLESYNGETIGIHGENGIGERIYECLSNTYNNSRYDNNTLIVYTMDGFLNESQAGQCIINYYTYYTSQMKKEHCFCGDRVGTLIQSNTIPDKVKDSKTEKHLLYNVGEIIHLGMNEATFAAQRETIKTDDYLHIPKNTWRINESSGWAQSIRKFAKSYAGNKSMAIYPQTPVYVKRIQSKLQHDIIEVPENSGLDYYYCFFHVMLRTLKYTNELVVDISKNSLQSLFWLGAAHGSDVNAIVVRHDESEKEREILFGSTEKKERSVFDVAGLWNAVLRSNDTAGFYRHLALAQRGIEQHYKLMTKNLSYYEELLIDELYQKLNREESEKKGTSTSPKSIADTLKEKEALDLESYYRDRFWKPMLGGDHLRIYLPQVDGTDEKKEPKLHTVKWDVEAIATLSHYLSTRTHIGEYSFQTVERNKADEMADVSNFITVGNDAKPISDGDTKTISLPEYIKKIISSEKSKPEAKHIHTYWQDSTNKKCDMQHEQLFRGFMAEENEHNALFGAQQTMPHCYRCLKDEGSVDISKQLIRQLSDIEDNICYLKGQGEIHLQIAQLVLWREVDRDNSTVRLRVSITGTSGPSTMALSTIFVNEAQRAEKFHLNREWLLSPDEYSAEISNMGVLTAKDAENMKNPLSKLQEEIRHHFMQAVIAKLDSEIGGANETNPDIQKIKYSTVLYLSSVLYRFFLPFLSLKDEEKLVNGLRYFLFSLSTDEKIFSFVKENAQDKSQDNRKELVEKTLDTLLDVLKSFKGVEAMYGVKVRVSEETTIDRRESLCISPLDSSVSCLFV